MKKISLFLVLLLVFGTVGAFAQDEGVSFGGNIEYFMTADEDDADAASNIGKARVNMSAPAGEFTSAELDVRTDTLAVMAAKGADMVPTFRINQFYIKSDVAGALGIEGVGINARFGKFEEWMANWNAATSSHRARNKAIETWDIGGAPNQGSVAVDVSVPDTVTFKSYVEFASDAYGSDVIEAYKLGVTTSAVPNLNIIASYSGFVAPDTKGYLKADGGYDLALGEGMSLSIPFGLLYNMETEVTGYYTGAKFAYDMFGVNLGIGGTSGADEDGEELDVVDLELMVSPSEIATLYAKLYTDPLADSDADEELLKSVDLGAKAAVGSMDFYAGYFVAVEDNFETTVVSDDRTGRAGVFGSGFYMGAKLSF